MFANSLYASLFTALGIAFGFVIAELVSDPAPSVTRVVSAPAAPALSDTPLSSAVPAASGELEELRSLLDRERRAREQLALRVGELDRQLAALQAAPRAPAVAVDDVLAEPAAAADASLAERWFDEQALIDGGMPSEQAGELKRFFEQLELEKLQLQDRASREDWERGRLRTEFRALNQRETALREQYGEAAYDAYLYASGEFNRVEITSVLGSAPAGQAGIRGGDRLLRYDNQRIYNPRDLRQAIAAGALGDTVEIEIARDDELLRFYLDRGPLGVRLNPLRIAP